MSIQRSEVLIIGAGLAGISAAHTLREAGVENLLLDKGYRVGGRMATRSLGDGAADYGAQFFTANSADFQKVVGQWVQDDFAYLWDIGWSKGSVVSNEDTGRTRYAVRGGMKRLMAHLAEELSVETSVRVAALRQNADGWEAETDNGQTYQARGVILTPPVPQSLALLAAGHVELPAMESEILGRIDYSSALTGIFRIEGTVSIPAPGAVFRPAEPLPWIADNQQKGVSENEIVVTVNSNGDYANRYWDAPEVEIIETMKAVLMHHLSPGSRVAESRIHRWRYAYPRHTHHQRTLRPSGVPPLFFAGDAFQGPLVEGAWLSGVAAAEGMLADSEFQHFHA